jgi:hypothetical protein
MRKEYRDRAKKRIKIETRRVLKTRALPDLALAAGERLRILNEILGQLFSDENFVTLLEAECLTAIPAVLRPVFEKARNEHEIQR